MGFTPILAFTCQGEGGGSPLTLIPHIGEGLSEAQSLVPLRIALEGSEASHGRLHKSGDGVVGDLDVHAKAEVVRDSSSRCVGTQNDRTGERETQD